MAHARPEYAITLAILGVLLAIGIPALRRGQTLVGALCLGVATAVLAWTVIAIKRERS